MAKKVLVVDDEKLIVKGIRFSLEQDGMEVDTAYDGEEALQKASSQEYDLILLDIMLPKLTGFEVCQTFLRTSKTREAAGRSPLQRGDTFGKNDPLSPGAWLGDTAGAVRGDGPLPASRRRLFRLGGRFNGPARFALGNRDRILQERGGYC